jgi:pyridoxal phosphate enzyme (YggS family)
LEQKRYNRLAQKEFLSMTIQDNLKEIHEQIDRLSTACSVQLLAVSKTFGVEAIAEAIQVGERRFGENYVQEGVEKIRHFREALPGVALEWHFIGPLQSNKTRLVAEHFDWVQSIDREKIARRLSEQRPSNLPPLNVLIEVNIDQQATKSGVKVEEVRALADLIMELPGLRLRGLMAIPEPADDDEGKRHPLRAMKALYDALKNEGYPLDVLSMGMSSDMSQAIEEGATMVRVGSAIFGERNYG